MIKLKDILNEGIPSRFEGYFDNVNDNAKRLEKNLKQLIFDLGKEGLRKESLEVAALYKNTLWNLKLNLKSLRRKKS